MNKVEELLAEYKYLTGRIERSMAKKMMGDVNYCFNRRGYIVRDLHNLGVSPKQIERLTA